MLNAHRFYQGIGFVVHSTLEVAVVFYIGNDVYELGFSQPIRHGCTRVHFRDIEDARRFTTTLCSHERSWWHLGTQVIEQAAHRSRAPGDRELQEIVAALIVSSRLLVHRYTERRSLAPRVTPIETASPVEHEIRTWIGIELLDDKGKPVGREPYLVRLSNGHEIHGTLDGNGRAREENIPMGVDAKVVFPRINKHMWK